MTRFQVFAAILNDVGTPIRGRVLDLGCGDGGLVKGAVDHGFDAYGCDFEGASFVRTREVLEEMTSQGRLLSISTGPYRLPFDDGTFDVVLSDQVFEHVQDYAATLAELCRVMKPGACSLHMFPPRTRLIEGHSMIPFGGILRSHWWLWIWAHLGIKNDYQAGLSARDVIDRNLKYLSNKTNYLTGAQIRRHFNRYFRDVRFVERYFLRYSQRARILRFAPHVYRSCVSRVVYARK